MKEYTSLVNSLFDHRTPYELLVAKRYPGASFAVFDVHGLITDIYNNPTQYLTSPANVTGQYSLCDLTGANCKNSALSLDHFLWYDELHPSQRTDEIIAKEFANVVKGSSKYATYWQ
jgi:phospholipase/lecithinase/hemolysin